MVRAVPALGLCIAAAAAVAAAAQQPGRRPLLGQVLSEEGPVADAAVILVGAHSHFDPDRDVADLVTASSDARGRFRADVIVGMPYCGYAVGRGLASPMQGWFGAGALVVFRCDRSRSPDAVQLRGAAPYAGLGPLQVHVRSGITTGQPLLDYRPLLLGEDGRGELPALCHPHFEVTVAGQPLWIEGVGSRGAAGLWQLVLPEPRELPFVVVDTDGRPLAGAEIRLRLLPFGDRSLSSGIETMFSHRHRVLGTTDAAGRLTALVPCASDPFLGAAQLLFAARAPGRAEAVSGFQGQHHLRSDVRVDRDDTREVRFALPAVEPLRGRVLRGREPAPRGTRVRLAATARIQHGNNAYSHDPRQFETEVAADGSYALEHVPAVLHGGQLLVLLPDGEVVPLPPFRGREPPQSELDLAAVAELQLTLLDIRLGPAGGVAGYLQPEAARAASLRRVATRFCTDPAGRCRLVVWPGTWFLFVCDGDSYAFAELSLQPGECRAAMLELAELPRQTGVLLDAEGNPAPGASLVVRSTTVAALDPARQSLVTMLRPLVQQRQMQVRTGADGSFAIPVFPLEGCTSKVQFALGGKRSPEFTVETRSEPLELRLQ